VSVPRASRAWDPDALAALEHERSLLLRDLRELDGQLRSGEIAPTQHAALKNELTTRTAELLTEIGRGHALRPPRTRRWKVAAGLGAAAVAAIAGIGWVLVDQLSPRVPPNTVSAGAATLEARSARLASVVAQRPQDVPARLAYARLLLQQQDLTGAAAQYEAAAEVDPTSAEALAYSGWIAVLLGREDEGRQRLDRAVAADDAYPDAHALRGLALRRAGADDAAAAELRRYLELAPGGPLTAQVTAVIERMGGER